jgi:hypothetical protein
MCVMEIRRIGMETGFQAQFSLGPKLLCTRNIGTEGLLMRLNPEITEDL